eukprot:1481454-Rhodomonas_salina.2
MPLRSEEHGEGLRLGGLLFLESGAVKRLRPGQSRACPQLVTHASSSSIRECSDVIFTDKRSPCYLSAATHSLRENPTSLRAAGQPALVEARDPRWQARYPLSRARYSAQAAHPLPHPGNIEQRA